MRSDYKKKETIIAILQFKDEAAIIFKVSYRGRNARCTWEFMSLLPMILNMLDEYCG